MNGIIFFDVSSRIYFSRNIRQSDVLFWFKYTISYVHLKNLISLFYLTNQFDSLQCSKFQRKIETCVNQFSHWKYVKLTEVCSIFCSLFAIFICKSHLSLLFLLLITWHFLDTFLDSIESTEHAYFYFFYIDRRYNNKKRFSLFFLGLIEYSNYFGI